MDNITEILYDGFAQQLGVDEVYFEQHSEHQHVLIFRNPRFGRVMTLDGVVQTTEHDEFIYHEMLAHVPIFAHGNAQDVLIVGGGDGAMLREVVRHNTVKRITQVEIDRAVIEMSKRYLPNHSQGAFDDPRVTLVINDGLAYVQETAAQGEGDNQGRFDVIISDSTDPIGPGEALFSADFYAACKRLLKPGGVLVTQNGVAFLQLDEVCTTAQRLKPLFADHCFYSAAVPTYVGGIMAFAWASDTAKLRQVSLATLTERYANAGFKTHYYNPAIHQAAFALPQYIVEALAQTESSAP